MDDPLWGLALLLSSLKKAVLIPLLVDDPLWVNGTATYEETPTWVLIPLLVDDPLWVYSEFQKKN